MQFTTKNKNRGKRPTVQHSSSNMQGNVRQQTYLTESGVALGRNNKEKWTITSTYQVTYKAFLTGKFPPPPGSAVSLLGWVVFHGHVDHLQLARHRLLAKPHDLSNFGDKCFLGVVWTNDDEHAGMFRIGVRSAPGGRVYPSREIKHGTTIEHRSKGWKVLQYVPYSLYGTRNCTDWGNFRLSRTGDQRRPDLALSHCRMTTTPRRSFQPQQLLLYYRCRSPDRRYNGRPA